MSPATRCHPVPCGKGGGLLLSGCLAQQAVRSALDFHLPLGAVGPRSPESTPTALEPLAEGSFLCLRASCLPSSPTSFFPFFLKGRLGFPPCSQRPPERLQRQLGVDTGKCPVSRRSPALLSQHSPQGSPPLPFTSTAPGLLCPRPSAQAGPNSSAGCLLSQVSPKLPTAPSRNPTVYLSSCLPALSPGLARICSHPRSEGRRGRGDMAVPAPQLHPLAGEVPSSARLVVLPYPDNGIVFSLKK